MKQGNPAILAKVISKARQRMITQYAVAGERAGAVLGTDRAAENITGFSRNLVMEEPISYHCSV